MQRTFATPGKVRVVVENEVGEVVITARESATTDVHLEAGSPGAEDLVERATVEDKLSGDGRVIRVKIPHTHGMRFVRRNGVTVRIELPTDGDIDVATASANVELNGTMGDVTVKTASGDITADDTSGALRAKSASGDISVGTVAGDLKIHSASGDLRADRVEGRAQVSTTSGDIEVGSASNRADVRSTSGDIRLGDLAGDASIVGVSGHVRVLSYTAGSMKIRAVSGNITVGVAQGVNLTVDAETMSGTVHSEIPLGQVPTGSGDGPAVAITARCVSGDVLVERAATPYVR
jgi:DUF4097 and DUF4098 domain-containing protein YvlB